MSARHQRGLTLLELVVAVAVLALFSVMAYGALDRVLVHSERVDEEQAFWRTLAVAFVRLEEDFAHARPRTVRDLDGTLLPAFRGQPTDTRALAEPSVEFTRGGVLIVDAGARADLQRVAYLLRDQTLLRLTWPTLDRAPDAEPVESVLLRGVDAFVIRFYDSATGLHDNWPVETSKDPLPRGVELGVRFSDRGEFTRTFVVNG